jgi:hypothetical protein
VERRRSGQKAVVAIEHTASSRQVRHALNCYRGWTDRARLVDLDVAVLEPRVEAGLCSRRSPARTCPPHLARHRRPGAARNRMPRRKTRRARQSGPFARFVARSATGRTS